MIGDTIGFTYNAVAKTLVKINQDKMSAEYYLDDTANLMRFYALITHTIPAVGKTGESHMIRLQVDHYDALGSLIRSVQAWKSFSTKVGTQDLVSSQRLQAALLTIETVANTDKVLKRES